MNLKEKRGTMMYVKIIQGIYEEVKISIKSVCGKTKNFTVKVIETYSLIYI